MTVGLDVFETYNLDVLGIWSLPAVTLSGDVSMAANKMGFYTTSISLADKIIGLDVTVANTAQANYTASHKTLRIYNDAAANDCFVFGDYSTIQVTADNDQNWTESLHGYYAWLDIPASATGTIARYRGYGVQTTVEGCTVTDWFGYHVHNPTVTPPAVITNAYGIFIENMTSAATLNYGIYCAATCNYIAGLTLGGALTVNGQVFDAGAGSTQINTTGSSVGLIIQGASTTSSGTIKFQHTDTTPTQWAHAGSLQFYGYDGNGTPANQRWGHIDAVYVNIGDGTESVRFDFYGMDAGAPDNLALTISGSGILLPDHSISFGSSVDSAAVADYVSISGYEISAGHRALAISSEEAVLVEADETKFSHKYPVRINGTTYYMMLTVS